jgi:hypothetical protein
MNECLEKFINELQTILFHDQIKQVISLLNVNLNIKLETDKRQLTSDK